MSCPGHTEIASALVIVFAFPKTGRVACAMHQFTALLVATTIELTRCNNESRTPRGRDAISRRARCGQGLRERFATSFFAGGESSSCGRTVLWRQQNEGIAAAGALAPLKVFNTLLHSYILQALADNPAPVS